MKTETEKELRELNEWVSIHVLSWEKKRCPIHHSYDCCGRKRMPNPTTNPADALAVLIKLYEDDPNDCLLALHNFLIRREFTERTLTPLKICQFAKQLFSK